MHSPGWIHRRRQNVQFFFFLIFFFCFNVELSTADFFKLDSEYLKGNSMPFLGL